MLNSKLLAFMTFAFSLLSFANEPVRFVDHFKIFPQMVPPYGINQLEGLFKRAENVYDPTGPGKNSANYLDPLTGQRYNRPLNLEQKAQIFETYKDSYRKLKIILNTPELKDLYIRDLLQYRLNKAYTPPRDWNTPEVILNQIRKNNTDAEANKTNQESKGSEEYKEPQDSNDSQSRTNSKQKADQEKTQTGKNSTNQSTHEWMRDRGFEPPTSSTKEPTPEYRTKPLSEISTQNFQQDLDNLGLSQDATLADIEEAYLKKTGPLQANINNSAEARELRERLLKSYQTLRKVFIDFRQDKREQSRDQKKSTNPGSGKSEQKTEAPKAESPNTEAPKERVLSSDEAKRNIYKELKTLLGMNPENAEEASLKKSIKSLYRKYHPDISKAINSETLFKAVVYWRDLFANPALLKQFRGARSSSPNQSRSKDTYTKTNTGSKGGKAKNSRRTIIDDLLSKKRLRPDLADELYKFAKNTGNLSSDEAFSYVIKVLNTFDPEATAKDIYNSYAHYKNLFDYYSVEVPSQTYLAELSMRTSTSNRFYPRDYFNHYIETFKEAINWGIRGNPADYADNALRSKNLYKYREDFIKHHNYAARKASRQPFPNYKRQTEFEYAKKQADARDKYGAAACVIRFYNKLMF